MHSFLIIGKTQEERKAVAQDLLSQENADKVFTLTPIKNTISIASIREVIRSLKVKHFNQDKKRAVIIEDANLMTDEAANAFLKTLEEPPENTIIILTAPNRESVLETIASRCFIKDLGPPQTCLSEEFLQMSEKTFEKLFTSGVGEKLTLVESLGDRQEATDFVVGQILVARKLVLKEKAKDLVEILERLEQTRKDLEVNVNTRLTLTELLLNYPAA